MFILPEDSGHFQNFFFEYISEIFIIIVYSSFILFILSFGEAALRSPIFLYVRGIILSVMKMQHTRMDFVILNPCSILCVLLN